MSTALLAFLLGTALAQAPEAPKVEDIVVEGVTVYPKERLFRVIRVKPGDRLHRSASAVAAGLTRHYHAVGYPAALAQASFDSSSGVLRLVVDEGRLRAVTIDGLEAAAAERALASAALTEGKPIREKDLRAALDRVEKQADGALFRTGDPPWTFEKGADGTAVRLHVQRRSTGLGIRPSGPGTAQFHNRVDGFAPWLTAEATVFDARSYDHLRLYAGGSYGFASKDVRAMVGAVKPVGPLVLGVEAHDITDTDDVFRTIGFEEAPASMLMSEVVYDYHRRRGLEGYLAWRKPRVQLGVNLRADRHESLPVRSDGRTFSSGDPAPNPAVTDGRMRSLIATARVSFGTPLFGSGRRERQALLVRSPHGTRLEGGQGARLEASLEVADKDRLGGDFTFRRLLLHGRYLRALGSTPTHSLRLRGLLGASSGALPAQKRLALGGPNTLRGHAVKAYSGEGLLLGTVEYVLETRWRRLGLVGFYDAGTVWGHGVDDELKDDVGVGLEWPAGPQHFVRVDVAFPPNGREGLKGKRVEWRIRLPY